MNTTIGAGYAQAATLRNLEMEIQLKVKNLAWQFMSSYLEGRDPVGQVALAAERDLMSTSSDPMVRGFAAALGEAMAAHKETMLQMTKDMALYANILPDLTAAPPQTDQAARGAFFTAAAKKALKAFSDAGFRLDRVGPWEDLRNGLDAAGDANQKALFGEMRALVNRMGDGYSMPSPAQLKQHTQAW